MKRILKNIVYFILFLLVVVFPLNLLVHFVSLPIRLLHAFWIWLGFDALILLVVYFIEKRLRAKGGRGSENETP